MQQRGNDLKALARPDFTEWTGRVLVNWIEIAAILSVANFFASWPVYILAIFLLGTRQHALAILGHEGAHHFAARHKRLNDALTSVLVLWPLGVGLDGYRRFHFRHHRRTGLADDPEFDHKRLSPEEWRRPILRRRLAWLVLRDLSGFAIRDIYRLIRVVRAVSLRDRVGPLAVWSLVLIFAYRFGALWAAALWWLAIISSYWAVFRMRAWTEHFDTTRTYRIRANWWQKLIFLPHNSWCHYEHHKWPGIPCWNLPKAREFDSTPSVSVGQLLHSFGERPQKARACDTAIAERH